MVVPHAGICAGVPGNRHSYRDDEFVAITGYHRKSAIRLLNQSKRGQTFTLAYQVALCPCTVDHVSIGMPIALQGLFQQVRG